MKALLVCPRYPDAFWTSKYARKFIGKKAIAPPPGLLIVAALLPADWELRFIDLNLTELSDMDIEWSDIVLVGAMLSQQPSALQVIERAKGKGKKVLGGGPLFCPELIEQGSFQDVDHIIIGEAEGLLPIFLEDLSLDCAKPVYYSDGYPDIELVPTPMWSLVDVNDYASVNIQFTRGCPHGCEYCYVPVINGHEQRVKSRNQIISELDALYDSGWRSTAFFCDDNLSGNLKLTRDQLLPPIIEWMKYHDYPFSFTGAACVNLAQAPDVMEMLVEAGFESVTLGIESTHPGSLAEVKKNQNLNYDMKEVVQTIQGHGLEVISGMMLGFDHDPPDIFQQQIDLIQSCGITHALINILYAFPNTPLYDRLKKDNRLVPYEIGDCVHGAINFKPVMGKESLTAGFKSVLHTLYSPEVFYDRMNTFLDHYQAVPRRLHIDFQQLFVVVRAIYHLGIKDPHRGKFWRLLSKAMNQGMDGVAAYLRQVVNGYFLRMEIAEYAPSEILEIKDIPKMV